MRKLRAVSLYGLAIVGCLAVFAVLVFSTPIPNYLSRPLVVESRLEKADVIVVLGGGVAQDGSSGDVSLRRAVYSAKLFHRRYAPYLIFSGADLRSNGGPSEAKVMAEIAAAMGVPPLAILLEEKSTRTVENALEVGKILRARKFRRVLLVTHPTHMRRSLLVFSRMGITALPAPTDGVEHLARDRLGRTMLFFRTIYEYAALVLYWWKGWV
jgi:uncharacterized SAM-binding protein YcdF (DUF218 family)